MESNSIRVRLIKTGETFEVPISLQSMIADVIKYICDRSIKSAEMNANDYYLADSSGIIFDDTQNLETLNLLAIQNTDLSMRKKKFVADDIMGPVIEELRAKGQRRAQVPSEQVYIDPLQR